LYSLHLYSHNKFPFTTIMNVKIPIITLGILLVFLFLGWIMKVVMIKVTKDNENPYSLQNAYNKITGKNGTSIIFMLGVIIPSVIYLDAPLFINVFTFIFVQSLLYILMSHSSALFPNLLFIIYGMHTFELTNGKYLISDQPIERRDNHEEIKATLIGDHSNTLCYVRGKK